MVEMMILAPKAHVTPKRSKRVSVTCPIKAAGSMGRRNACTKSPRKPPALCATAALTGARLGELLALQWRHIDLVGRKLRIERSLWRSRLFAPKTVGSVRTIYFGEGLAQALTAHSQEAARKSPEDFVFCKPNGEPLHPDVLRKDVLYPALDRLGILRSSGASGFHTFRHSAASFINAQTGNLKLAQKLLGHSTIDMTAEVYTHTSAEAEREAALAVERAIYGDLFPNLFPIGNNSNVAAVKTTRRLTVLLFATVNKKGA
jgi:integrase